MADQGWVKICVESASRGYGRQVKKEMEGGTSINRPERIGRKSRQLKKLIGKSTWFFKAKQDIADTDAHPPTTSADNRHQINADRSCPPPPICKSQPKPETVLFVPYTPGGELRKILQKVDSDVMGRQKYGRVKVVERLGDNLVTALTNKAPWRSESCGRQVCMPCSNKAGHADCRI